MQLKSRRFAHQKGFTLIEMAIVLVIIGMVATVSMSIYKQYKIKDDWDTTQQNMDDVMTEITRFYETYGRYPCPASATAVPGDALYGNERTDCSLDAAGTCTDGVCTVDSLNVPQTIAIGSLPFKKLNLQDKSSYDRYLSRMSYAVTSGLTDADTFNPVNGGITITDGDATTPTSMVKPENTGHFVVISHGPDKSGAISRNASVMSPCNGLDAENCDGDETFISREIEEDFDDIIRFHTQFSPTEWKSDEDNTSISLKTREQILVNANPNDNGMGVENVTVRKKGTDTGDGAGDLRVDNNIYAEELCDEDIQNCFNPRRIAGSLVPANPADPETMYYEDGSGSGISCYQNDGVKRYLNGISDNAPDCTDEIVLECPDGQFVTSVVDGKIRCNEIINDCPETEITTFCGDSRTLPQSPPSSIIKEYSGECRYITDYDAAYFEAETAGMTKNQARVNVINVINNEARNVQACESGNSSQVRNTYVCEDDGWRTLNAHEKRRPWYSFPSNIYAGGSYKAENSYGGIDNNNNNHYHDCWCREDYRVVDVACPNGSYDAYRVQKHTCPQTDHYWTSLYTNYDNCSCTPTTKVETMSCNAYYNQVNGAANNPDNGLIKNVYLTYEITCGGPSGTTPIKNPVPIDVDATQCECANGGPKEDRTACTPSYYKNDWTNMNGGHEVNVEQIKRTPWVCPGTETNGLTDPAFRDDASATIELATDPCACGGTVPTYEYCPNGLNGKIFYDAPIDCVTGDPVADDTLWTETSRDCRECRWESGSSYTTKSFGPGVEKGAVCACGLDPEPFCSQVKNSHSYKVWNNCQCTEQ